MNDFDVSRIDLEKELLRAAYLAEKLGEDWAEKKSLYESLEDKKKVVFSDAMPLEGSVGEKERVAYISIPYRKYLEGLAVARLDMNKAYIKYSGAKDKFEAFRSLLSMKKAEAQRGI